MVDHLMAVCNHKRTAAIQAHCKDGFSCILYDDDSIDQAPRPYTGYVPLNMNITNKQFPSADDVEFKYCLDCGQILEREWPADAEFDDFGNPKRPQRKGK